MSNGKTELLNDLRMTNDHWDTPVRLRLVAFTRFCQHMDDSLRDLVARWEHLAAPCARKVPRKRVKPR